MNKTLKIVYVKFNFILNSVSGGPKSSFQFSTDVHLTAIAEDEGFEPSVPLRIQHLSRMPL